MCQQLIHSKLRLVQSIQLLLRRGRVAEAAVGQNAFERRDGISPELSRLADNRSDA